MPHVSRPATPGQGTDPPEPRPYARAAALMLTPEEAHCVRVAIRRVARAVGGFVPLAVKFGIPTATLHHAANPKGRPTGILAIRLAAVAGVPVEALLGGRLAVAPPVIGVAA